MAIAQIKAQRSNQAIPVLEALARKHSHPWIKLALAEAYENENQMQKALDILEELANFYPGYLPVTMRYAEALSANNQSQKSITLLNRQLQYDDNAIVHQALARAYFINGQTAAALESTGNQYLREGYLELASQQYENALQQPNISESSRQRLNTRKQQLKEKLQEKIQSSQ
jgi:predicted Zn-dependent protease